MARRKTQPAALDEAALDEAAPDEAAPDEAAPDETDVATSPQQAEARAEAQAQAQAVLFAGPPGTQIYLHPGLGLPDGTEAFVQFDHTGHVLLDHVLAGALRTHIAQGARRDLHEVSHG
jgi:hypothetical protein